MAEARPVVPHADIIVAGIDAAEAAGLLPHGGVFGKLVMPDPVNGACCDGSAVKGPQYCTCWTPRFDTDQEPTVEGEPGTRAAMCEDCAYRPGSPERSGDERYNGDQEFLDQIVVTGERFFCHAGIRQAVKLVHPSGAEVDLLALAPGDYRPPIVDGIPYKADGSPGDLCAGWAARRRAYVAKPMPEFSPEHAGENGHPLSPAAVPAAPPRAHGDGAAAERAIEGVPPSPIAPAPEAQPPALGAARPSSQPPRGGGLASTSPPESGEFAGGARDREPGTPVAGFPPAQSPARGARSGAAPLAGQDGRAAWKAAESANAKAKRNGRGRYPVKRRGDGYTPGMSRRMPPGGGLTP